MRLLAGIGLSCSHIQQLVIPILLGTYLDNTHCLVLWELVGFYSRVVVIGTTRFMHYQSPWYYNNIKFFLVIIIFMILDKSCLCASIHVGKVNVLRLVKPYINIRINTRAYILAWYWHCTCNCCLLSGMFHTKNNRYSIWRHTSKCQITHIALSV